MTGKIRGRTRETVSGGDCVSTLWGFMGDSQHQYNNPGITRMCYVLLIKMKYIIDQDLKGFISVMLRTAIYLSYDPLVSGIAH